MASFESSFFDGLGSPYARPPAFLFLAMVAGDCFLWRRTDEVQDGHPKKVAKSLAAAGKHDPHYALGSALV